MFSIDENDETNTSALLDSLWWRMAKSIPPSMKTPGMVSPAKHIELRKNLRKKIAMDVTQGDVLCLRKSVAPSGSGVRSGRRRYFNKPSPKLTYLDFFCIF